MRRAHFTLSCVERNLDRSLVFVKVESATLARILSVPHTNAKRKRMPRLRFGSVSSRAGSGIFHEVEGKSRLWLRQNGHLGARDGWVADLVEWLGSRDCVGADVTAAGQCRTTLRGIPRQPTVAGWAAYSNERT